MYSHAVLPDFVIRLNLPKLMRWRPCRRIGHWGISVAMQQNMMIIRKVLYQHCMVGGTV